MAETSDEESVDFSDFHVALQKPSASTPACEPTEQKRIATPGSSEVPHGQASKGRDVKQDSEVSLASLLLRVERFRVENEILQSNISSLFNTARAELEKRDATIASQDRKIARLEEVLKGRPPSGGSAPRSTS